MSLSAGSYFTCRTPVWNAIGLHGLPDNTP
jgi:hypothetical protein